MFEAFKTFLGMSVEKSDPDYSAVSWLDYMGDSPQYSTTPTVEKAIELYANAVTLPEITGINQPHFERELSRCDRDYSRDGWAFMRRNPITRQIRRIAPGDIFPESNTAGQLTHYRLADGGRRLSLNDVCQFPYRTAYAPQSAVSRSKVAIDLFNAVIDMNMRVFRTGMLGAPILVSKTSAIGQNEAELLKRKLQQYASNTANDREPLLVEGDVEIIKPESPGSTLFLQEAIDQHRKLVGDAFLMQGALLGDTDSATFTNQGLYDSEFWVFAVVPRLEMYRAELETQIGVAIDYDFSSLPQNPMGAIAESGGAAQIAAFN